MTGAAEAEKLGKRISRAVAMMTDGPGGALLAPVTVSIGVACIIPDARAIHQDLLGAADRAPFDAQQGGRNCVVAAPLPPGLAKPRLVASPPLRISSDRRHRKVDSPTSRVAFRRTDASVARDRARSVSRFSRPPSLPGRTS